MEYYDHTVIGWKVWHEWGPPFCSKYIDWKDLPDRGIVVVVVYKKAIIKSSGVRRTSVFRKQDYYWMIPAWGLLEVFCSDEHPTERYPNAVIKKGKRVSREFEKMLKRARETKWED